MKSYKESREFTKISLGLGEYGIQPAQAVKIYKLYGDKSPGGCNRKILTR